MYRLFHGDDLSRWARFSRLRLRLHVFLHQVYPRDDQCIFFSQHFGHLPYLPFVFPSRDDDAVTREYLPFLYEMFRGFFDVFRDVFRRAAERRGGGHDVSTPFLFSDWIFWRIPKKTKSLSLSLSLCVCVLCPCVSSSSLGTNANNPSLSLCVCVCFRLDTTERENVSESV